MKGPSLAGGGIGPAVGPLDHRHASHPPGAGRERGTRTVPARRRVRLGRSSAPARRDAGPSRRACRGRAGHSPRAGAAGQHGDGRPCWLDSYLRRCIHLATEPPRRSAVSSEGRASADLPSGSWGASLLEPRTPTSRGCPIRDRCVRASANSHRGPPGRHDRPGRSTPRDPLVTGVTDHGLHGRSDRPERCCDLPAVDCPRGPAVAGDQRPCK